LLVLLTRCTITFLLRISVSGDSLSPLVLVVEAQAVIWSLGGGTGHFLLLFFELLLAQMVLKGAIVVKTEGQGV
jgi:hypothetical protein